MPVLRKIVDFAGEALDRDEICSPLKMNELQIRESDLDEPLP